MSFDFETIRRQLSGRVAKLQNPEGIERRAAVAAILRPGERDTEVLLIRRAERPGDPWSGHMAFPGGHWSAGDADLRATAERETMEEVGLDLGLHDYLGQLDELIATARGRMLSMSIAPYVFSLRTEREQALRPNYEVAELVWGSLGQMFRGEIDAVKEFTLGGEQRRLPAFDVHGHLVWGMTYYMLRALFSLLGDGTLEPQLPLP